MEPFDLILKGAGVYDAGLGLRGQRKDIGISGGRVRCVADAIDPAQARKVEDLDGCLVSPGWIDIHVHGYGGLTLKDPQALGTKAGVTTNIDAGSFGTLTFDDFRACREASIADMGGFIHLHPTGIPYTGQYRADYSSVPVGTLVNLIGNHRDIIHGVKLGAIGSVAIHILQIAKVIAEAAKVPFYMHIGEIADYPSPISITQRAMACLKEGDIAVHPYCNDNGRILDKHGKVFPEVLAARDRGVLFDVGHGVGNFSYEVADQAMEQGIFPDLISSDQNNLCGAELSDLPFVMSKFMALGFSLEDVVEKTTWAPRKALKLTEVGTLREGSRADITVFSVEEGSFEFGNSDGHTRRGSRRIVAHHVYKDGERHECDVEGIYRNGNFAWQIPQPSHAEQLDLGAEHRTFLAEMFARWGDLSGWDGGAIHASVQDTARKLGMPLGTALEALYLMVFGRESYGFTPQVGWLIARQGPAKMKQYREALRM